MPNTIAARAVPSARGLITRLWCLSCLKVPTASTCAGPLVAFKGSVPKPHCLTMPIRQASGAYRIIYLTTIGDVVHVLHAFQKKTQATAKRDIDLAKARLRQIR